MAKPHDRGKSDHADAAERGTASLDRDSIGSSERAVERPTWRTHLAPALLGMFSEERSSGREDRGESEEQSGDDWAGGFGNDSIPCG